MTFVTVENREVEKIRTEWLADVEYDKKQLTDPLALGVLVHRLLEERKKTNEVLAQILEKLDSVKASGRGPEIPHFMLSDVDQKLLSHVQRAGKVTAENIQADFNYKGKNAASARLNSLYEKGLLTKGRAGKKVYYWVQG